jgi:hypothetical protein
LEFVTPESMKKARSISAYPSDPLWVCRSRFLVCESITLIDYILSS